MDTGEKVVLLCEDSLEGMLTAIYEGFVIKNQRFGEGYADNIEIHPADGYEYNMFSSVVNVETDYEKAEKTIKAIHRRLGEQVYLAVLRSLCHFEQDRAVWVFGFLIRAFRFGSLVLERMSDDYVMRTIELSRKSWNEAHLFNGFIRFREVGENRVLYAKIEPKCNVLPLIEGHFSERFPGENFIIYDEIRQFAIVHTAYKESYFMKDGDMDIDNRVKENGQLTKRTDDNYGALWDTYFNAIFIKERENERCQNTMIPKWYRKNMPEFNSQKG